jgi:hypothetical protein
MKNVEYSVEDNVVTVPEIHLGMRNHQRGYGVAQDLTYLLRGVGEGRNFEITWKFRVITKATVDDSFTVDNVGIMLKLEELLTEDTGAVFLGANAIEWFFKQYNSFSGRARVGGVRYTATHGQEINKFNSYRWRGRYIPVEQFGSSPDIIEIVAWI